VVNGPNIFQMLLVTIMQENNRCSAYNMYRYLARPANIPGGLYVLLAFICYRPRSRGDNTFGSVRVHVCPFVCGHSPV